MVRDEVLDEMVEKKKQADQQAKNAMDLQKRYDQEMKMLGEKDLEIAILKDLVKKTTPTSTRDSKYNMILDYSVQN